MDKARKKRNIIILAVVAALVLFRLLLPSIALHYVNKALSEIDGHYGHVDDIDIALIRGAYVIKGIKIEKVDSVTQQSDTIPFFTSPEIDLSVQWGAIFQGAIAGEVYVMNPVLNFVKQKDEKTGTIDFQKMIKRLMPLTINHFEIEGGEIHYIDRNSKPPLNIALKGIAIKAFNLKYFGKEWLQALQRLFRTKKKISWQQKFPSRENSMIPI